VPWRHLKSPTPATLASWNGCSHPGYANAQRVAPHHVPTPGTGPSVDPTALTLIAAAVPDRMRIAQRDAFNDLHMRLAHTPATIHWGNRNPPATCIQCRAAERSVHGHVPLSLLPNSRTDL
jgi:hypothetical protein